MNIIPHILVIDSESNLAEKLSASIRDLGFNWQISPYQNVESALQLLDIDNKDNEQVPDLIIVDANAPDFSAFDFLYCAKKHRHYKETPIIMLDSATDQQKRDICYHFNGNAFCKAPDTEAETIQFVQSLNDFWIRSPQRIAC